MVHIANRNCKCALLTLVVMLFVITETASGQTTAFSYQGRLSDAGNPADGLFDMQFKLFNTMDVGTGTQQGPTVTNSTVQITKGVFSLMLDFGNVFDGSARFLEISLRPTGSPAARTILSPRQPITSTPYALHSLTAANAMQLSGMNPTSFVQFTAGGNVGIGTSSPTSKLDIRGNLTLESGSSPVLYTSTAGTEQNRYLQIINSPSSPTASGLKAGGILVADGYGFANPGKNDLIVKGNVGIGTPSPQSPLAVQTGLGYGLTHTNGAITVGTFVDSTGGWLGTRSNHPLHFFTNDSSPKMTMDTAGNVGIGTTTPLQRLHVHGNEILSTGDFSGFKFRNRGSASSADEWVWYSQNNVARLFRQNVGDLMAVTTSGNVGIGTTNPDSKLTIVGTGANGFSLGTSGNIGVGGNAVQPREKGGFPKAMLFVFSTGIISRCYNGTTGASLTGGQAFTGCGFTVNRFTAGGYGINFGFQVNDRFVSVTPQAIPPGIFTKFYGANFEFPASPTSIDVYTFDTEDSTSAVDRAFMIIVY